MLKLKRIKMDYKIGKNSFIGKNVIIYPGTSIGNNVRIDDNSVIGKLPMKSAISSVTKEEKTKPAKIGDNVKIGANSVIYSGCEIKNEVLIADLASIREDVFIGEKTIIGRGTYIENKCKIGKKCKIETNAYITAFSELEDYVFIAPGVLTSNDNYAGRDKERIKHFKGVTIKKGGRIGVGAVIMPGIVIGKDALIGAGALVTKNVPDKEVWVGMPAKYKKDVPEAQLLINQEFYDGD
jgi:UDP-2-acetamido-3-amino-2,3-dideoxy-glucuronate N-acetyltransferase